MHLPTPTEVPLASPAGQGCMVYTRRCFDRGKDEPFRILARRLLGGSLIDPTEVATAADNMQGFEGLA